MKFEEELKKLEEINGKLQNRDTDLTEAVELYESGMKIAKKLDKELSALERRVEIVTGNPSDDEDSVVTEPYQLPIT
ncbi:MAG: exodeoxyribonuclease VII small subunit [Sphaerochaetaceae bacterium]|nr:exodeoxyribonuclease VII small subunit [Sphaerochaetaceae bacterium]